MTPIWVRRTPASRRVSEFSYALAVKNARSLLEQQADAQRKADNAGWLLGSLTCGVVASGVQQKQWASDIGASEAHVSTLRTMWSRYASRRRELSYRDAYELAGASMGVAEALEAEAKATGLTVSAVRSRAPRGGVDLPQDRTQHTDVLLKKLVMARRNVLTVSDAIEDGPTARQKPLSREDLAAIEQVASEIARAASDLVQVLDSRNGPLTLQ
jgi:hypothetical protein